MRKGTVVALFLPTCPEYLMITLGVLQGGGITSGANPMYKACELDFLFGVMGHLGTYVHGIAIGKTDFGEK